MAQNTCMLKWLKHLVFGSSVGSTKIQPTGNPVIPNKFHKSQESLSQAKKKDNCVTTNIVTSSVRNNSKCIAIPPSTCRTDQYKLLLIINTHSLYGQLLIGTTWTKTLCPQRKSKVSSPCSWYIATKSLSTHHIIAQHGSYHVTLQIQMCKQAPGSINGKVYNPCTVPYQWSKQVPVHVQYVDSIFFISLIPG